MTSFKLEFGTNQETVNGRLLVAEVLIGRVKASSPSCDKINSHKPPLQQELVRSSSSGTYTSGLIFRSISQLRLHNPILRKWKNQITFGTSAVPPYILKVSKCITQSIRNIITLRQITVIK